MPGNEKGSDSVVQLSTVFKIAAGVLAISLGATGYVATEFRAHAEGMGHLETAESLATLKQSSADIERRLTDIEVKQGQAQEQIRTGFEDLKKTLQDTARENPPR